MVQNNCLSADSLGHFVHPFIDVGTRSLRHIHCLHVYVNISFTYIHLYTYIDKYVTHYQMTYKSYLSLCLGFPCILRYISWAIFTKINDPIPLSPPRSACWPINSCWEPWGAKPSVSQENKPFLNRYLVALWNMFVDTLTDDSSLARKKKRKS